MYVGGVLAQHGLSSVQTASNRFSKAGGAGPVGLAVAGPIFGFKVQSSKVHRSPTRSTTQNTYNAKAKKNIDITVS